MGTHPSWDYGDEKYVEVSGVRVAILRGCRSLLTVCSRSICGLHRKWTGAGASGRAVSDEDEQAGSDRVGIWQMTDVDYVLQVLS